MPGIGRSTKGKKKIAGSEMIVVHQRSRRCAVGSLRPSSSLPVILRFFRGNPGRQSLMEALGKRVNVRLIELAKFRKFLIAFRGLREFCPVLLEGFAAKAQHVGM